MEAYSAPPAPPSATEYGVDRGEPPIFFPSRRLCTMTWAALGMSQTLLVGGHNFMGQYLLVIVLN